MGEDSAVLGRELAGCRASTNRAGGGGRAHGQVSPLRTIKETNGNQGITFPPAPLGKRPPKTTAERAVRGLAGSLAGRRAGPMARAHRGQLFQELWGSCAPCPRNSASRNRSGDTIGGPDLGIGTRRLIAGLFTTWGKLETTRPANSREGVNQVRI